MKKYIFITSLVLAIALLFSCSAPNPILGTWEDSNGNKLVLEGTGLFEGSIYNSSGTLLEEINGAFYMAENTILFMHEDTSTHTEAWEIDGGMLYITWTDTEGHKLQDMLRLFRTKKD